VTGPAKRPRFSIVTAVYDVEPYLADFIASMEAQRVPPADLEVVAVDDGSTDGSLDMLRDWARRSRLRVKVFTKPNGGQGSARNLGLTGWLKWKRYLLPAVFPSFVTGAITASGGSWNASIVAEYVTWGDTTLQARGLGSYIAQMTATGDFPRIALGIGVMCVFVMGLNRFLWRRLYRLAEDRMHF